MWAFEHPEQMPFSLTIVHPEIRRVCVHEIHCWNDTLVLRSFHSLFCHAFPLSSLHSVGRTCVHLFRLVIQRRNSHLAFNVVNVCQNELTFKIYIFDVVFVGWLVLLLVVRSVWQLPSFSVHLKFSAGIFECKYICGSEHFCTPQWCDCALNGCASVCLCIDAWHILHFPFLFPSLHFQFFSTQLNAVHCTFLSIHIASGSMHFHTQTHTFKHPPGFHIRLFRSISSSQWLWDMMLRTENTICIRSICNTTSCGPLSPPPPHTFTAQTLIHCSFSQLKIKIKLMTLNKTDVDNGTNKQTRSTENCSHRTFLLASNNE